MSTGPTTGFPTYDDVKKGVDGGTIFLLDVVYVIDADDFVVVVPDGEGGGAPMPTTFNAQTDFSTFLEDNEQDFSFAPYVPAYIPSTGQTVHTSPCDGVVNLKQMSLPSPGDTTSGSGTTRFVYRSRTVGDHVESIDQISIGSI